MYQIGDRVVYGVQGVCDISAVEQRSVNGKKVEYFVLKPVDSSASMYYVPCHNPAALAKLRPVLDKQQIAQLLSCAQVREDCWISDETQRKNVYRSMISSCDREALLQMIHTLHRHRAACRAAGKKFHLCDENFLRDAQRLLAAEFSTVLGIDPAQVGDYIQNAMGEE